MTDFTMSDRDAQRGSIEPAARPNLDQWLQPAEGIIYLGVLAAALLFVAYSIYADVDATGTRSHHLSAVSAACLSRC